MNRKTKAFIILLPFFLIQLSQAQNLKFVPAKDSTFTYVGRHVKLDNGNYKYALPGVSVYTTFTGTTLELILKDYGTGTATSTNYLAVVIDNENPLLLKLNPTDSIFPVSRKLKEGEHTLQIIKRTESFVGAIEFKGINIESNASTKSYKGLPKKKILFIGNSITCGYGNDTSIATNPSTGFTSKNENNYQSYGQIAARKLNTQYHAFAFSGRGLYKNYDGSIYNPIPVMFDQVIPENTKFKWNHEQYQPNIIFCNLGTNDFSSESSGHGSIDSITFCLKYEKFISRLKTLYPKSTIVLTVGTMMSDYYPVGGKHWTRIQAYTKAVVETEQKNGNSNIYYLAMTPQVPPYGEDWHPSVKTHEKMAQEIVQFIENNKLLN